MRKLALALPLAALFALAVPASIQAQSINGFRSDVQEIDPNNDAVLRVQQVGETGSTLAYVYVADAWYNLRCFQRQRFAKSMRQMWRQNGGSNIVVKDKTGTTVADFQMFGSDFDVRGCDG